MQKKKKSEAERPDGNSGYPAREKQDALPRNVEQRELVQGSSGKLLLKGKTADRRDRRAKYGSTRILREAGCFGGKDAWTEAREDRLNTHRLDRETPTVQRRVGPE